MLFLLIGWDTEDSREKRPGARPDHLAYWKDWDDAGKIVIAGPLTDFAGSMFLVEVDSEEEARTKMEADPYIAAGVFARVECHPFKAVLPTAKYG